VVIVAASKKQAVSRMSELRRLGQKAFGENYVQEALAKMEQLQDLDIEWHFIGPLQSNKSRPVAERFDWMQSADRPKILKRLSQQRPPDLPPLNVCIEVNIDREPQKSGVLPEQALELAELAAELPGIHLRGLMAIPLPPGSHHDPSDSYRRVRDLFEELRGQGIPMDTLSMGMSGDLEKAIMHGSTMVRIGTDLLGPRPEDHPEPSDEVDE
jgi:pyridoxal phosphate enzyme (YggS family)